MDVNEFSIVLPSNSSMEFFPKNTTTNFSTKLPREVKLSGKWVVGVSEIHVPCTTLHLTRKDTEIKSADSDRSVHFQHGTYDSLDTLVRAINEGLFDYYKKRVVEKFFYDKKGGYVIKRGYDKNIEDQKFSYVTLTAPVELILGYDHGGELTFDTDENEKKKLVQNLHLLETIQRAFQEQFQNSSSFTLIYVNLAS